MNIKKIDEENFDNSMSSKNDIIYRTDKTNFSYTNNDNENINNSQLNNNSEIKSHKNFINLNKSLYNSNLYSNSFTTIPNKIKMNNDESYEKFNYKNFYKKSRSPSKSDDLNQENNNYQFINLNNTNKINLNDNINNNYLYKDIQIINENKSINSEK